MEGRYEIPENLGGGWVQFKTERKFGDVLALRAIDSEKDFEAYAYKWYEISIEAIQVGAGEEKRDGFDRAWVAGLGEDLADWVFTVGARTRLQRQQAIEFPKALSDDSGSPSRSNGTASQTSTSVTSSLNSTAQETRP